MTQLKTSSDKLQTAIEALPRYSIMSRVGVPGMVQSPNGAYIDRDAALAAISRSEKIAAPAPDAPCQVIGCDGNGNLYNSRGHHYGKCECATKPAPNAAQGSVDSERFNYLLDVYDSAVDAAHGSAAYKAIVQYVDAHIAQRAAIQGARSESLESELIMNDPTYRAMLTTQQEAKAEGVDDWEKDANAAGLIVNGLAVSGARLNAFYNGHRAGYARAKAESAPSSVTSEPAAVQPKYPMACSSCYGSGIDVAGKPCGCNCEHAIWHKEAIAPIADEAPAGPVQGEAVARYFNDGEGNMIEAPDGVWCYYEDAIKLAASPPPQVVAPSGWKLTHERAMAGYDVACKYGVYEGRAFKLVDDMFAAFALISKEAP